MGSQETKRRLFSEKTSAVEWVRVGYVVSWSFGKTVPIILLKFDAAVPGPLYGMV